MKLSTVVLCALSVALTVLAAEEGKTFSQWEQTSGVQAKTAGGYYDKKEVKHICLKEKEQHNCRYVGCPALPECNSETGADCNDQYDCVTHLVSQSDLECCHDEYGYDGDASSTYLPSMKVGTCDWDADIYQCDNGSDETCNPTIPMANGAFKIGTAWATCYLNSDAEYCGSPLCDRMVLSFQGGLYVMPAYSKTAGSGPDEVCFPFLADSLPGIKSRTRPPAKSHMSALSKSIAGTGLMQKLFKKFPQLEQKAAAEKKPTAKVQYTPVPPPTNSSWFEGIAVMMSGPVTVTSMDRKVGCNQGMLEYVPVFLGAQSSDVPGKTAMVVKPNSYDITLACDGQGCKEEYYKDDYYKEDDYKKDDYYKKDEYKEDDYKKDDYYKEDDYYKKDEYKNRY